MTTTLTEVELDLAAPPAAPLRRNPVTWLWPANGGVVVAVLVLAVTLVAVVVPQVLTPYDPLVADPLSSHLPPSLAHPAGTDLQGRDVLARIIHGARYSMLIGIGATLVAVALGMLLGVAAGSGPKWLDSGLSRTVDVVASFPEILLALFLIAFTGRGVANLILALGVAGLPRYARMVRSNVLVTRTSGYVEQARTFGVSERAIVLRHVLPNALGALPIMITIGLGGAIIGSSGLSFLGLGPQPPDAEWGLMLAENRAYLRQAWWSSVFPGMALTAVVISATVLGRTLQARYERRHR